MPMRDRPRLRLWTGLALFALGLAVGTTMGRSLFQAPPGESAALAVVALALGVAAILNFLYWRSLDEFARTAHKDAWFFGAGATFWVVMFAVLGLAALGERAIPAALADLAPTHLLAVGAASALALLYAGYVTVWLAWRAVKR